MLSRPLKITPVRGCPPERDHASLGCKEPSTHRFVGSFMGVAPHQYHSLVNELVHALLVQLYYQLYHSMMYSVKTPKPPNTYISRQTSIIHPPRSVGYEAWLVRYQVESSGVNEMTRTREALRRTVRCCTRRWGGTCETSCIPPGGVPGGTVMFLTSYALAIGGKSFLPGTTLVCPNIRNILIKYYYTKYPYT